MKTNKLSAAIGTVESVPMIDATSWALSGWTLVKTEYKYGCPYAIMRKVRG